MNSLSERFKNFFFIFWGLSAFRYLFVGGLLFLLDLSVFLTLAEIFSFDIRLAQAISRTAGAVAGFGGHKYISFRTRSVGSFILGIEQGMSYTLLTIINIFISPFIVQLAVHTVGGSLTIGKVVAEMFIVMETYFLLRFVFRKRDTK
ncbi:MAG: GtrA family protein [Deltaproteobacteria bacterium]|nr:GtrA family protein [Deltaproteobacteria bacterium]